MKIGLVVVTYNRLEMLKKCLAAISNLNTGDNSVTVYIIDNASNDGTKEYVAEWILKHNEVEYFRLPENTGGSGGFSFGITNTYYREDALWIMDDDAFPQKNALIEITNSYKMFADKKICLLSNSNYDNSGYDANGLKIINTIMFVGLFIPTSLIKEIGVPRGDFFIYHDDTEYCYRMKKHSIRMYKCKDSVIEHKNGLPELIGPQKLLFWDITFYKLSDWKLYYYFRNRLLKYDKIDPRYWKVLLVDTNIDRLKIAYLNPVQSKIVKRAIKDGCKRIAGTVFRP